MTRCALCGSGGFSLYEPSMYALDGQRLDLMRCQSCAFVFVSPRPTPGRLRALYASEKYYETDYTLGVAGGSYFARRVELLAIYDHAVADLEATEKAGKIFEVGAAGGFFLEAARRRGWSASGVEISPFAAEYARREFGIDVQTGDVTEATVAPASQDVVYVDNILEHTIDPLDVLARLFTILRPGGLLVVIVPTYVNSIYFRTLKVLRGGALGRILAPGRLGSLLKLRPSEPSAPYHIDEFTAPVLRAMVEKTGFRVEKLVGSVPIPDYLQNGGGGLSILAQKVAFRSADALMRAAILPGARAEIHARRPAQ